MSSTLRFDDEASRRIEAIYSTPDVVAQRQAVSNAIEVKPGERVLDIGSGPGFLAAEMAASAAPNGTVVGTDTSGSMLAIAGALSELARVLRPGGRALVLDTDWDSIVWHSGDLLRMRRVMDAWGEHLVDPHLPRRLIRLLDDAGLTVELCRVVPIVNVRSNTNTYSQGMVDLIADFVPGRQGLTEADVLAWRDDLNDLSHSGNYFFPLSAQRRSRRVSWRCRWSA
jgi:arsenite methyltransferase